MLSLPRDSAYLRDEQAPSRPALALGHPDREDDTAQERRHAEMVRRESQRRTDDETE